MIYARTLAFDPSGNWEENKGTTGVCLFDNITKQIIAVTNIRASDFTSKEAYWQRHVEFIKHFKASDLMIVIEDFTLDPKRALQQSHSRMETPKLIGIMQLACSNLDQPYQMQRPCEVKTRWADSILEYKKYIIKYKRGMYKIPNSSKVISRHCKDAIRHAVHFATFKNKEKK